MAKRDEVEEFLRRAAARRQQGAAQGRQRAAQPPAKFVPPPAPTRSLPELVPIEAEVVDAELADTNRVGDLVTRDMRGVEEIAQQTSRLGAEVDQADDKLAAHLQQVFDHRVGQLKDRASQSVPQPAAGPAAAPRGVTPVDLAQMLYSPQHVRNAILVAEILRRPEERW
jgi:hypothetical protein